MKLPRYQFLDGMRGIAALCVALVHVRNLAGQPRFLIGEWCVAVFITISGFCLTLSTEHEGGLTGGVRQFAIRRARRILPPYYAALVLALFLRPQASAGDILAHVFLVQNITAYIYAIDGPAWSLATEWQIYFVFALVLVPVWRRYGRAATILCAAALGFMPTATGVFLGAAYHLLICFALGMCAVWLRPARWQLPVAGLLCGLAAIADFNRHVWSVEHYALLDTIVGIATMAAIASMKNGKTLSRCLSSPIPVFAGRFSYSLYLIHMPILERFHNTVTWAILIPATLAAAYLFSLVFEKPFLKPMVFRFAHPRAMPPISGQISHSGPSRHSQDADHILQSAGSSSGESSSSRPE